MKKLLLISITIFLFFTNSFFYLDPDFGWHLQTGRYILEHGIPYRDLFTYTASTFSWINHEWLHDVLIAFIYNKGGYTLLATFFAALWTIAIFLASRKQKWLVMVFAALAIIPYVGIRPVVWSILLFSLLERLLEKKKQATKIILPLLFLIWANLHGGFFVGLIIIAGHRLFTKKISLVTIIFSFLATFINPYGIRLYEELGRTVFDGYIRFKLLEWQPFIFNAYAIFYIALFISFSLFVNRNKAIKHKLPFIPVLLFMTCLTSTRNTPLFIVSSLRYLETYIHSFLKLLPKDLKGGKLFIWRILQICAFGVLLWGVISTSVISKDRQREYPQKAVIYLKRYGCKGNLFNNYNYGGYLIWKLPEKKVYIDGRMPSWSTGSGTYLRQYLQVLQDQAFRKNQFAKYSITCALLRKAQKRSLTFMEKEDGDKLAKSLIHEGWKKVAEDEDSILLIAPASRR